MDADGTARSFRELTPQESSIIAEVIARNTTMPADQAKELLRTYTVSYDDDYTYDDRLLYLRTDTPSAEIASWPSPLELCYNDTDRAHVSLLLFIAEDKLKDLEVIRGDQERLLTYPPSVASLFKESHRPGRKS